LDEFLRLPFDRIEVSATVGTGLDQLRREVFQRLEIVRVYTKHPKEKEADRTKPFAIRRGETLVEVAANVHRDMADSLKGARVWGATVHAGTMVKPDYQPQDGDVVELHAGS
jgi:ribosome-interacting GTPase 1